MEHDLWGRLRDAVSPHGHIERIENMVGSGMPDVTYCIRGIEGFIELKYLGAWPRDPATVVKLRHFTPQQRIWLRQRTRAGGRVYVLLQVGAEYILMTGEWAQRYLGISATREEIRHAALDRNIGVPITKWIVHAITQPFTFPAG